MINRVILSGKIIHFYTPSEGPILAQIEVETDEEDIFNTSIFNIEIPGDMRKEKYKFLKEGSIILIEGSLKKMVLKQHLPKDVVLVSKIVPLFKV